MATTVLFQTPQGGTLITSAGGNVELASLDISANQNIRILLGSSPVGLTYTVKISSAATGQNSDVEFILDNINHPANTQNSHVYPQPLARRFKVNVRLTSGTTQTMAKCIIMGN